MDAFSAMHQSKRRVRGERPPPPAPKPRAKPKTPKARAPRKAAADPKPAVSNAASIKSSAPNSRSIRKKSGMEGTSKSEANVKKAYSHELKDDWADSVKQREWEQKNQQSNSMPPRVPVVPDGWLSCPLEMGASVSAELLSEDWPICCCKTPIGALESMRANVEPEQSFTLRRAIGMTEHHFERSVGLILAVYPADQPDWEPHYCTDPAVMDASQTVVRMPVSDVPSLDDIRTFRETIEWFFRSNDKENFVVLVHDSQLSLSVVPFLMAALLIEELSLAVDAALLFLRGKRLSPSFLRTKLGDSSVPVILDQRLLRRLYQLYAEQQDWFDFEKSLISSDSVVNHRPFWLPRSAVPPAIRPDFTPFPEPMKQEVLASLNSSTAQSGSSSTISSSVSRKRTLTESVSSDRLSKRKQSSVMDVDGTVGGSNSGFALCEIEFDLTTDAMFDGFAEISLRLALESRGKDPNVLRKPISMDGQSMIAADSSMNDPIIQSGHDFLSLVRDNDEWNRVWSKVKEMCDHPECIHSKLFNIGWSKLSDPLNSLRKSMLNDSDRRISYLAQGFRLWMVSLSNDRWYLVDPSVVSASEMSDGIYWIRSLRMDDRSSESTCGSLCSVELTNDSVCGSMILICDVWSVGHMSVLNDPLSRRLSQFDERILKPSKAKTPGMVVKIRMKMYWPIKNGDTFVKVKRMVEKDVTHSSDGLVVLFESKPVMKGLVFRVVLSQT